MHYYKFYPDVDYKITEVTNNKLFASSLENLKDKNEGKLLTDPSKMPAHPEEVMAQCYRRAITCFFHSDSNRIVTEKDYMWDEYANHHKGFCVEYNENILNGLNPLTEKTPAEHLYDVYVDVEYGPDLIYGDRTDNNQDLINALGHKLSKYENENETRLIFRFPPIDSQKEVYNKEGILIGEHVSINENAISAIYLGRFASIDTLKPIIQFADKYSIPCYKLELSMMRIR